MFEAVDLSRCHGWDSDRLIRKGNTWLYTIIWTDREKAYKQSVLNINALVRHSLVQSTCAIIFAKGVDSVAYCTGPRGHDGQTRRYRIFIKPLTADSF